MTCSITQPNREQTIANPSQLTCTINGVFVNSRIRTSSSQNTMFKLNTPKKLDIPIKVPNAENFSSPHIITLQHSVLRSKSNIFAGIPKSLSLSFTLLSSAYCNLLPSRMPLSTKIKCQLIKFSSMLITKHNGNP